MKRKAIVLFIAVTMILWTATPSFAAAETREISANYSGITLYIDLEPVALLDANGNAVTPFIADGTTYLPVRAISEALGMEVVWEADTKSVRINEKPESVPAEQTPTADEPEGDAAETTRPAAEDAAKDADAASEPAKDADATDAAKDADATEAPADETAAETPAATEETTDVPADEADATESFVGTKALSVTYSDIAIYVNDTEIAPKDAGGNAVEPFIADGTTYLPVRAVAEALGLTVLWDGASKSIYVGEQPENLTASADKIAYAKYLAAAEAIEAADSYAATFSGDTVISRDGKKTETTLAGSVKLIKHSDTDVEFISETTVTLAGTETPANVYYRDGFLYTESGDEKTKMALPFERALAQAQASGIEIEEDAIKTQSADGDTITFTLDGGKLSEKVNTVLSGVKELLPASGTYTFGDIVCTATLDDAGALKDIRMSLSTDLTAEDTTITITYDLTTSYTQVGGVSITAPADLSSYKDLDTEAK